MKNFVIKALVVSVIGLVVGYVLTQSYAFEICVMHDVDCHRTAERIGDAMLSGSLGLAIVFGLLLLIPEGFKLWKRFAVFYIPFALLVYVGYPDPSSGDFFSPHASEIFPWISVIYVAVSLTLIGYARFRNKKIKST